MDRTALPQRNILLFLQLLLVSGGIIIAALAPPAHGSMIAVPLIPHMWGEGLAKMIEAGARIERAGPTPGSLVLVADRNAIAAGAITHGILLLPTYVAGCQNKETAA